MSDATLVGTHVAICDWHGKVVWISSADTMVKVGEVAWAHLAPESQEKAKVALARVVTLHEITVLETCNLNGEHHRTWAWPLKSPELAVCLLAVSVPPQLKHLTSREREIMSQLALGKTASDVAKQLDLSPSTVNTHLRRARQKLDLPNMASLSGFAAKYLHPPVKGPLKGPLGIKLD